MEPIIRIKHLRKVYRMGGEKVVALGDINLTIEKGDICCILGTSGSGKSTLLNQLAGLEKPTRGGVYIRGTNISKMDENKLAKFRQAHLGFVFQSYNLMESMTAVENVSMPLMFQGLSRRKRNKAAAQMLHKVGLASRSHHRPSQMSGGQQQRVGIARAFVGKPALIFADEPTGNLDTKTTKEVMELMVGMARRNDLTIVLVTHNVELAAYADRIITLVDGAIVGDTDNCSIYWPKGAEKPNPPEPEPPEPQEQEAQPGEPGPEAEQPAEPVLPAGDDAPPPAGDGIVFRAGPDEADEAAADTGQPG